MRAVRSVARSDQMHAVVATGIDAPVWTSFTTAVGVGYVRAVPEVTDAVLVSLLPHLREGVQARDATDYQV